MRRPDTAAEELYLTSDGDHVIIERSATATQRTYIWAGATLLKSRATGSVELHLYQDRLGSVVLAMKRESGSTAMHGRALVRASGLIVAPPVERGHFRRAPAGGINQASRRECSEHRWMPLEASWMQGGLPP